MNILDASNLVLLTGLIGFICFDLGVHFGKKQGKRDQLARAESMRRHPSYHLRSTKAPKHLQHGEQS
jgi:hypothetical protein